jgi:hypothetical protein
MLVALTTTKLPMLAAQGFWHMAHESRTDWSIAPGVVVLAGDGGRSVVYRSQTLVWREMTRRERAISPGGFTLVKRRLFAV